MQDVKPGDVLLYAVAVRENRKVAHYYAGEVVGSISGGCPLNLSGEPITAVRAIYRRNSGELPSPPGRNLLARDEDDPGEKLRLSEELERIYGPGELVTSVSCCCESTCGMPKKRPGSYSE